MNPLVSVAIVTYNQKEYLRECIESILEQDYDNKEIIVADDGSTDGTHEMLLDYEKKYPNQFILKLATTNVGITKNHNLAHSACNGKYISWMGGDDLMLPGKLKKQVSFMEANPNCTILYHNLEVFFSDGNQESYLLNSKKTAREGDVKTMIKYGCFNGACSTMLRTDKAPVYGFDERLPIASDWMYWVDSLANGGEIRYIDEVLGKYRRHANNVTSDKNYNAYIDHLNSCNILLTRHPELQKIILYRYSENLRALRFKSAKDYRNWLAASIRVGFNTKSFIIYILNIFSLRKIKK
ncbi:glycosyltransferase [Elizabethkingia ursingii]|uniref:glycosyltransferase n=1 Tax=Elizabethkingia ursingii TaxID=1756150 RepID=UPI0007518F82|nr:glycosyltransferase [Elizabethkingia ursingii]KUY27460.1 glycosyl transferase 2 family protein [Elizabethkingia ursingii]